MLALVICSVNCNKTLMHKIFSCLCRKLQLNGDIKNVEYLPNSVENELWRTPLDLINPQFPVWILPRDRKLYSIDKITPIIHDYRYEYNDYDLKRR